MKPVEQIAEDILSREGGYVDHPADRGGPTNWGITQATLSRWLSHPASVEEVKALTRTEAKSIYLKVYFVDAGIATAPAELQAQLFDINVNGGLAPVTKRLTGYFGSDLSDIVDFLGPKTANMMLAASRIEYYRRIVAGNPSQKVFLAGWLNRAAEFMEW